MSYPHLFTTPGFGRVATEVDAERARQDARFGEQNHPDIDSRDIVYVTHGYYAGRADNWRQVNEERATPSKSVGRCTGHPDEPHSHTAWDGVLLKEVYEALAEEDPERLRAGLIKVAAVACAWIAAIDRRTGAQPAAEPESVCICGHPERQHHKDVCLVGCGCDAFLDVTAAAEEITRLRNIVSRASETSPDVDPVYDPKAWETYRRDAGCGCTAAAPVDCKVPHGTGAWLCVCHRLSSPPAKDTDPPGKPLSQQDASIRQFFQDPNRCASTDGIFRCSRPTGHPGDHRTGRTFWHRRPEDGEPTGDRS